MPPLHVLSQRIESYQQKKSELDEAVSQLEERVKKLKSDRKAVPKHIPLDQLCEAERLTRCPQRSKHFLDTIKMVAYRATTVQMRLFVIFVLSSI